MSRLTDDAISMLVSAGVGTSGVTLFEGFAPSEAETAVVLTPYGGAPPTLTATLEEPSLQAWVRAPTYADAEALAMSVMHALGDIAESTVGGRRYLQIDARQNPTWVGQDERGRHEFSVNFNVIAERYDPGD